MAPRSSCKVPWLARADLNGLKHKQAVTLAKRARLPTFGRKTEQIIKLLQDYARDPDGESVPEAARAHFRSLEEEQKAKEARAALAVAPRTAAPTRCGTFSASGRPNRRVVSATQGSGSLTPM